MADRHDYHIFLEFEIPNNLTLPSVDYLGTTPAAGKVVINNGGQKTLQIEFEKSKGNSWYGKISNTSKQHCLKEILSNFEKHSSELLGYIQSKAKYKIFRFIPIKGQYKIKKCHLVQQEYDDQANALKTDIESIQWEETGRVKNFKKELKNNSRILIAQSFTLLIIVLGFGPGGLFDRGLVAFISVLVVAGVNLFLALLFGKRRLKRA